MQRRRMNSSSTVLEHKERNEEQEWLHCRSVQNLKKWMSHRTSLELQIANCHHHFGWQNRTYDEGMERILGAPRVWMDVKLRKGQSTEIFAPRF